MSPLLRSTSLLRTALLLVFFGFFAGTMEGSSPSSKKPTAPAVVDHRILIASTDPVHHQVNLIYKRDGSTHTYIIDDLTAVMINGNPGKFSDLMPGLQISDYVERDAETLDKIAVIGADSAPAAAKPHPKKKPAPKH